MIARKQSQQEVVEDPVIGRAVDRLDQRVDNSQIPAGVLAPWLGTTANVPSGWLVCLGQRLSATRYPTLFAAVGLRYGGNVAKDTFMLPDTRGRLVFGRADSGSGSTLGGTFGAIDHTHAAGTLAVDSHAAAGSGTDFDTGGPDDSYDDHTVSGSTGTGNPPCITMLWIVKT